MKKNVVEDDVILSVESLTKYSEGDIVLDNLSFSLKNKGVHGILAPEDSGKTVLTDILSCSVPFDGGNFRIGERIFTPTSSNAKDAKKKIGYVRKNSTFYPTMTVLEVMSFVGEARGIAPGKLVRQINEALLLTGLESIQGRLVKRLSAYELKLLDFACALLGNPDIVIINGIKSSDFAFGKQKNDIYELIGLLGEMKTVIIATDDFSMAKELCDDIVLMSDGRVIAKGSIDDLEGRVLFQNESLESLYNSLRSASRLKKKKNIIGGGKNNA